jgi:hypothetical protein
MLGEFILHKIDHNARFYLGCLGASVVPCVGRKLHRVSRRGLVGSSAFSFRAHIALH